MLKQHMKKKHNKWVHPRVSICLCFAFGNYLGSYT